MQPASATRFLFVATLATGCGTVVLDDRDDDGQGGARASSTSARAATGANAANATGTTGADASAGATTGGGPVPPLACGDFETVMVAGSAAAGSLAARVVGGAWSPLWSGPPSGALLAYADPMRRLGLLTTSDAADGIARLWVEAEPGLMVESSTSFAPLPPVFASATGLGDFGPIVMGTAGGWGTAVFDVDAQDWFTWQPLHVAFLPGGVSMDPTTGRTTVVGRDQERVCLVDTEADGVFGDPYCIPGVVGASPGEVPNKDPQIVGLGNGVDVVVYMSQVAGGLAATVRHGDAWSAPVGVVSDAIGISFAATRGTQGDIVVGTLSTNGDLSVLRFSEATGWTGPARIDGGFDAWVLAAAPGACGADAFLAASRGGSSVDVAHVHGLDAAIQAVLPTHDDFAWDVRLATRAAR